MRYQHVRMEMKMTSKMYVHEKMHVNNKAEMSKACSTCVHRKERNCNISHEVQQSDSLHFRGGSTQSHK